MQVPDWSESYSFETHQTKLQRRRDARLCYWVFRQKHMRRVGTIKQERVDKLSWLGLTWRVERLDGTTPCVYDSKY